NRSRWAGVACGFIDRQVPLITCTSIRMEACEREKISIRYIHWVKLSPRPPRETGAARPRKPSSRSSAKSSGGASPVASIRADHSSPGPSTQAVTWSRRRSNSSCASRLPRPSALAGSVAAVVAIILLHRLKLRFCCLGAAIGLRTHRTVPGRQVVLTGRAVATGRAGYNRRPLPPRCLLLGWCPLAARRLLLGVRYQGGRLLPQVELLYLAGRVARQLGNDFQVLGPILLGHLLAIQELLHLLETEVCAVVQHHERTRPLPQPAIRHRHDRH